MTNTTRTRKNKYTGRGNPLPIVLLLILLGVISTGWFFGIRPYMRANTAMPQDGSLEMLEQLNGMLYLTWPAAEGADAYIVEILDKTGEEVLWSSTVTGLTCQLPKDLRLSGGVVLRISPSSSYRTIIGSRSRIGTEILTVPWSGQRLDMGPVTATVDPDDDVLTLVWNGVQNGVYTLRTEDGQTVWEGVGAGRADVVFRDDDGDLPAMSKGEYRTLFLSAGYTEPGIVFRSAVSKSVIVDGEEFLGTVLKLQADDLGNNYYTLYWNQTQGDHYEVQELMEDGRWQTIWAATDDDPLSCNVGPLKAFTDYNYRVVAPGAGFVQADGEYAVAPGELSFTTGTTTMYATIWPLKDLPIYADTDQSRKVGTAYIERSYCVMGEKDGMFLVYFDGGKGYIDSTYCLINLPDYMGALCAYNITNSYDAIYKVHDYGIADITGTVVPGYEEVAGGIVPGTVQRTVLKEEQPEDLEAYINAQEPLEAGELPELIYEGLVYETVEEETELPTEFLVPLLYPTAQKIAQAALEARELGYRLKIYDAYRPWITTNFLYTQTMALLDEEIPEFIYNLMAGGAWARYLEDVHFRLELPWEEMERARLEAEGKTNPEPEEPAQDPGRDDTWVDEPAIPDIDEDGEGGEADGSEPALPPEEDEPDVPALPEREPRMSIYTLMTNNTWGLGSFLAGTGGSRHNVGVAVDLTMEVLEDGEELEMQTAMHDLSWYSVLSRNNDNADLLAGIMTGCGLGTLVSEWWHFQDDELYSQVPLVIRREGVTRAGWMFDGIGWLYRDTDGEFLVDCNAEINGFKYIFDADGYSNYAAWEEYPTA